MMRDEVLVFDVDGVLACYDNGIGGQQRLIRANGSAVKIPRRDGNGPPELWMKNLNVVPAHIPRQPQDAAWDEETQTCHRIRYRQRDTA
jgi:hypothetical protein